MRKFCMLNALPGLLLPLQSIQAESPSQIRKPNIMLILADDMGFYGIRNQYTQFR